MSNLPELPAVAWQYVHKQTGRVATLSTQVDMSIAGGQDYREDELCSRAAATASLSQAKERAEAAEARLRVLEEALRELMDVQAEALGEMKHAHLSPAWFTKGQQGATQQFLLWWHKGMVAIQAARAALTPPQNRLSHDQSTTGAEKDPC